MHISHKKTQVNACNKAAINFFKQKSEKQDSSRMNHLGYAHKLVPYTSSSSVSSHLMYMYCIL